MLKILEAKLLKSLPYDIFNPIKLLFWKFLNKQQRVSRTSYRAYPKDKSAVEVDTILIQGQVFCRTISHI